MVFHARPGGRQGARPGTAFGGAPGHGSRLAWRWWRLGEVLRWWPLLRHPRVPGRAKLLAVLAMVYLVAPLDLIPDTIPVLGWVDDWLVLGSLTQLAQKGLDPAVQQDLRTHGQRLARRWRWWLLGLALALTLWLAVAVGLAVWLWRSLGGAG